MLWAGQEFTARSRCDLDLQGRDPNLRATRRVNMVVISVKLFQNSTSNNEVMGRTQMGRTYGRTDRRTDGRTRRRLYAPPKFSREHNKMA